MKYAVPTPYLLNYITTLGGTLETLYGLVAAKGPLSLAECRERLDFRSSGTEEDHAKNGLNFLHTCGLLQLDDDGYSAPNGLVKGVKFRLLLIEALRKLEDHQGDFMRIHEVLVRDGQWSITDDDLITIMNRKEFTTPGEADINPNKAAWWIRTSDYLGLVRQLHRQKRILLMPDPELLLELLRRQGAEKGVISLTDWLKYCEERYLTVITRNGQLHLGVAAVLSDLAARNRVKVFLRDDADSYDISHNQRVTHLAIVKEDSQDA